MNKLALCIGINNYPGTDMDLGGCVNDAGDWGRVLAMRGFKVDKLIDAQGTKQAMVAGFRKVIASAASGDLVVITFSGHGTYELDLNGDELKGLDQALCPYDLQTAGQALTDDEIHALFKARQPGVRIVLISDSCHSGSVNRAVRAAAPGAPRKRFMPLQKWMPAARLQKANAAGSAMRTSGALGMSASATTGPDLGDLLLSGCEDGETDFSYDATISGRPNGAFTFYALKAIESLPADASYAAWHAEIIGTLPTVEYPQHPQIVASAKVKKRPLLT